MANYQPSQESWMNKDDFWAVIIYKIVHEQQKPLKTNAPYPKRKETRLPSTMALAVSFREGMFLFVINQPTNQHLTHQPTSHSPTNQPTNQPCESRMWRRRWKPLDQARGELNQNVKVDGKKTSQKEVELSNTVDGWNPVNSPVEVGSLSHYYLQGFLHLRWLFGISEPSTVVIRAMRKANTWGVGPSWYLHNLWRHQGTRTSSAQTKIVLPNVNHLIPMLNYMFFNSLRKIYELPRNSAADRKLLPVVFWQRL